MKLAQLHCHSMYSNLSGKDAMHSTDSLIEHAAKMGMSAVAITEHDFVGNHLSAIESGKKHGVKVLLGNEIYLVADSIDKETKTKQDKMYHFILLAKDAEGHAQIRELSSLAWSRSWTIGNVVTYRPTYYSDLKRVVTASPGHLIATTACIGGMFGQSVLAQDGMDVRFCKWCKGLFVDDFYLELQPNSNGGEQRTVNQRAIEVSQQLGIKTVVTCDVHYLEQSDRRLHKAYLQSDNASREVDDFYSSTYMMGADEIVSILGGDIGESEAIRCIENTNEVANKCSEYDFYADQEIPNLPDEDLDYVQQTVPDLPYLQTMNASSEKADRWWVNTCIERLNEKGEMDADRLELEAAEIYEISKAKKQPVSGYMAVVAKVLELAKYKADAISNPGRGSACAGLSNYALGITTVNPLTAPFDMPFHRFLHRDRPELPDIDIDLPSSSRDAVVEELSKFLAEREMNIVRVGTFATETTKSALKTAFRGFKLSPSLGDSVTAYVPSDRGFVRSLKSCLCGDDVNPPVPQLVTAAAEYPMVFELAQKIEGLVKNRGSHASGYIIHRGQIHAKSAVMKSKSGEVTTQYCLEDCEKAGLMKFDLLTTKSLDIISEAIKLTAPNESVCEFFERELLPSKLDYVAPAMWDLIPSKSVTGLFQFDSAVTSAGVVAVKPTTFAQLIQVNSLVRLMPSDMPEETCTTPSGWLEDERIFVGDEVVVDGRKVSATEYGRMKVNAERVQWKIVTQKPIDEFIKYRNSPSALVDAIDGLSATEQERTVLLRHLAHLNGIADTQESLMALFMDQDLVGMTVTEANKLRKVISKKLTSQIPALKAQVWEMGMKRGVTPSVLAFLWHKQAARQMGYAFSILHTTAYTAAAMQQLNFVHRFGRAAWDAGTLIVASGMAGDVAKQSTIDRDKMATAAARLRHAGGSVVPASINSGDLTFSLDNNQVQWGLTSVRKINRGLAQQIIANRPYSSFKDFVERAGCGVPHVISLIKARAFEEFEQDRTKLIFDYLSMQYPAKGVTLVHAAKLAELKAIPDEYLGLVELNAMKKNPELTKQQQILLSEYGLDDCVDGDEIIDAKIFAKRVDKLLGTLRVELKDPRYPAILQEEALRTEFAKHKSDPRLWDFESTGTFFGASILDGVKVGIRSQEQYTAKSRVELVGIVTMFDKDKKTITLDTKLGVVALRIGEKTFNSWSETTNGKENWLKQGNLLLVYGRFPDTKDEESGAVFTDYSRFILEYKRNGKYSAPIKKIKKVLTDGTLLYERTR